MKNKFNFFLSALLVFLFGMGLNTCSFAGTNYEQINEVLNSYGYSEMPVNSNTTSLLSENNLLISFINYNSDFNPNQVLCVVFMNDYNLYFRNGIINYNNNLFTFWATNGSNSTNIKYVLYDINSETKELTFNRAQTSWVDAKQIPAVSNFNNFSSKYTFEEFSSYSFNKKLMSNSIIYNWKDNLFFGNTSQDLLYKFDGVFTGNDLHEPYNSKFNTNIDMWRFDYFANTNDYKYLNYSNYFYLQEMSPGQAVQLTDEDIGPLDENTDLITNLKFETNFNFTSLIKKMQQGYIYRLLAISNSSGDYGYRSSYSTTQFFSLNSWKSNSIKVLNIYELVFPENPDIEQEGGNSGGIIDLENIENSINNANQNYWGSPESINPEDFENELENNFNGIMENLSGELTQNQIFESLQGAEDGFLNFFKEQQNEQFYDLAFSWPDVEFMSGDLIPAGGINISEMCREIPELETLRSYIRVIFNFSVAVALIKQIYNLILSTLGIDNPYLYEDYDEVTSINEDTGEYRQTAVRRKKIYNRRR